MRKALGSIPSVSSLLVVLGYARFRVLFVARWACAFATARLAQSAERKALNLVVVGSSPTVGAFSRRLCVFCERACVASVRGWHVCSKVTLAGLEPAIFGSEDQRLIH